MAVQSLLQTLQSILRRGHVHSCQGLKGRLRFALALKSEVTEVEHQVEPAPRQPSKMAWHLQDPTNGTRPLR